MAEEMCAETAPAFTVNDFPTEIIERFAPDLRPRTVSTLRLVSRRFRDVFTADRFYRCYLWYGDRPGLYRGDLQAVGDAQDRWRSCLEAEKRRLDNWRRGRPTRVETVRLPRHFKPADSSFFKWQTAAGEANDYWLMCELEYGYIVLSNVTDDPVVTVVDVRCHTRMLKKFALILPDQVIIRDHGSSIRVFNIRYDGRKLSLEYLFTFDEGAERGVHVSGRSNVTRAYMNLYIAAKQNGVLAVWDLKRAVQLDDIVLSELLPPDLYVREPLFAYVKRSEFPYVFVALSTGKKGETVNLFLVVDLDERRLALCFPDDPLGADYFKVQGNTLLFEQTGSTFPEIYLTVYDLRTRPCPGAEPRPLFRVRLELVSAPFSHLFDAPSLIYQASAERVACVHLDEPEVLRGEIDMRRLTSFNVCAAFGPFLLVEIDNRPMTLSLTGYLVFDWVEMISENGVLCEGEYAQPVQHLRMTPPLFSMSKRIVENIKGDCLYICHF